MEENSTSSGAGCIGRGCRGGYRAVFPMREFNEIFARLPSNRDRALVAFYVSTGARASELLSATLAGIDPGRHVITVVRKGTREWRIPGASADAFVWLRLYQVEMADLIPRGRRQPLWWTLRRPVHPLTYHAAHRMFERVDDQAGTAATFARLAAHGGLSDGAGSHLAADGCPVRFGSCSVDHNSALPDAAQGRCDSAGVHAITPSRPGKRAADPPDPGGWIPSGDTGGAVREWAVVTTTIAGAALAC